VIALHTRSRRVSGHLGLLWFIFYTYYGVNAVGLAVTLAVYPVAATGRALGAAYLAMLLLFVGWWALPIALAPAPATVRAMVAEVRLGRGCGGVDGDTTQAGGVAPADTGAASFWEAARLKSLSFLFDFADNVALRSHRGAIVAEVVVGVLFGVASALHLDTPAKCTYLAVAMAGVAATHAAYLVVVRPLHDLLEQRLSAAAALLQVALAVTLAVATGSHGARQEAALRAVGVATWAQLGMLLLQPLVLAAAEAKRYCARRNADPVAARHRALAAAADDGAAQPLPPPASNEVDVPLLVVPVGDTAPLQSKNPLERPS